MSPSPIRPPFDFEAYLDRVETHLAASIGSGERQRLRQELTDHLLDVAYERLEAGATLEDAHAFALRAVGKPWLVAEVYSAVTQESEARTPLLRRLSFVGAVSTAAVGFAHAIASWFVFWRVWYPPSTPLVQFGAPEMQRWTLPSSVPLPDGDLSTYALWMAILIGPWLAGIFVGRKTPYFAEVFLILMCLLVGAASLLIHRSIGPSEEALFLANAQLIYWPVASSLGALVAKRFRGRSPSLRVLRRS